jgi:hypothetical protein
VIYGKYQPPKPQRRPNYWDDPLHCGILNGWDRVVCGVAVAVLMQEKIGTVQYGWKRAMIDFSARPRREIRDGQLALASTCPTYTRSQHGGRAPTVLDGF